MANGCGVKAPWPVAKVSGKISFTDGSLIKGTQPDGTPYKIVRIVLQFNPEEQSSGKYQNKPAYAEVDPLTGTFESATTWRPAGDGAIVGKHKVLMQIYAQREDGSVHPISTMGGIPDKYWSIEKTPLEVEVKRGENYFDLRVEKAKPKVEE